MKKTYKSVIQSIIGSNPFFKVEKLIDSICCWSSFPHSHLDPEVKDLNGRNLQPLIWWCLWSLASQILSETQNDTIQIRPSHFKTANMFPKVMQCLGSAGACSLQHILLDTSSTSQVDQLNLHVWIFKRPRVCDLLWFQGQQCNIKFITLHFLLGCFRIIFNNINYLYFMRQQQRFVSTNMFPIYTSSRHWVTLGFIWSRVFGCLKSNKSNICSTFHSGFVSTNSLVV